MVEENEQKEFETDENNNLVTTAGMCRNEKRKLLKKLKRKQVRKDMAIKERKIADALGNDPEETMRLLRLEQEEAERMERDRREYEERERLFVLGLERKRKEEELIKREEEESNHGLVINGDERESEEGDDWEYVEEGPAEIIWKGNEIIVKKKKVKVPKKVPDLQKEKQESERPISNPLAPQSEAYKDYKSAQEVLECVAQQVPNFGTEQDKAHCPFHLKTGVCRFGVRCSRAHFYPDKSCTLLFKNMYSGPGLAYEQDDGLEYTDDEVDRSFEEFYEDVHTEFLKYGEIMNFKVCKNASSHLRGNVYVHYKSLESAVLAYQSINGRYFAGKQLSCEFVNLTKWKVAICGEYMRSRLKTCSRGSVCNFIHCFRNPGGDYEWADWDKPAPRYWLKEMDALFGYTNDKLTDETLRCHSKRSRSRDPDSSHRISLSDDDDHRKRYHQRHRSDFDEKISSPENYRTKRRKTDRHGEPNCSSDEQKAGHKSINSKRERELKLTRQIRMNREHPPNATDRESRKRKGDDASLEIKSRTSTMQPSDFESGCEHHRSNEKLSDLKKIPHADKEISNYRRHYSEDSLHNKEAFSSDINYIEDSLLRYKNTHRSGKSLHRKDGAYLSDSDSSGSKFVSDVKSQKNRKFVSVSNSQSEYREYKSKSDSLERDEDQYDNHSIKSSIVSDGGGTETDGKGSHKCRGKSKKSDNRADLMNSERERLHDRADSRRRRSIKNRKWVKHEAESCDDASDGGISQGYKKKPKNDKRTRSDELDFLDVQSNIKCLNKEERQDGHGERNNMLGIEYGRCVSIESMDHKCDAMEMENISLIDKSNEETTTSQEVPCFKSTSSYQSLDGKPEDDLEQKFRIAALKKVEEMMKYKDTPPVQSRMSNVPVDIHSRENIVGEDAEGIKDFREISSSIEARTSAACGRRKRI